MTKLVRHDRIYIWLLFFQGFNFWRIGKPCESRVNLDHLSKIESGEVPITIDEDPSDSYLFELIDFMEDPVEIQFFHVYCRVSLDVHKHKQVSS